MAFQQTVALKPIIFTILVQLKKIYIRDNTFEVTKAGHYQLTFAY